ncbi:MAG: HAD family acid phosphatase [Opitutales bacterium]
MRTQSQFGILISFLFLTGSFLVGGEGKLPNDVRWVRQSTEHKTLCEQLFRQATVTILRTVKTEKSTGNLAVVVDLDETVLDNSLYQVERWKAGLSFTQDSWSDWVNRKEAGLIPGAEGVFERGQEEGCPGGLPE